MARRAVLEPILQHIHERIAHLPRASERAPVPTIRPKPTAAQQHAVHAPRYPHHEPTHARSQRGGACGLDDQMHVVILHRVMHEPEARRIAIPQRAQHGF